MNREIKFRGKGFGVWRYGNYVHFEAKPMQDCYNRNFKDFIVRNDMNGEHCFPIIPDTIGRYTGLKDKNGKEIYEGDIVAENGDIIGSIFLSARYGISIQKNSTTWSLINFCMDSDFDCGTLSDIEVIGNIHDNSELL